MSDASRSPYSPPVQHSAGRRTNANSAPRTEVPGNEHAASTNEEREAAELVARLLDAAEQVRAILCARLAHCELNEVRYAALSAIDKSAPEGCSQTQLASALEQSESSISTLVDRMRVDGLLYRLRSKSDRRRHLLMLTPRGRELLTLAREDRNLRDSQLVAGLDAPQVRMLASLLGAWVSALVNRHFGPPPAHFADALPSDDARTKPTAA